MAVGAIEPEFRRLFLEALGLQGEMTAILEGGDTNPATHARIAAVFASRSRRSWEQLFDGGDACVSPVLGLDEVADHPQNRASSGFAVLDGAVHPMPVPRFSRTSLPHPRTVAQAAAARWAEWDLE
jgi:alpha-methylacyl-CoA racemase